MSDANFAKRAFQEMIKSDLQGGTVSINNAAYDCTVGTFTQHDDLLQIGVSPKMMGDVQVLLADLPANLSLDHGLELTVMPNSGKIRQCRINSTQNQGNLVSILVWDDNEGA